MKRLVVCGAVLVVCLSCTSCAIFTVQDKVTEDGRHVRSLSIGRTQPYAKYTTFEPKESESEDRSEDTAD